MKKIFVILIILVTMLLLISCSANQPSNNMPNMGVKAENWNTSIKLADDPMLSNSFKNGQDLTLGVENLSTKPIVFLENFGMRVLTKYGQDWVDIQSNFYNSGLQYLPTKASYPLGLLVSALPYIPNLASPINIRIVIIGHTEDNDKVLLGAYFDVTLNP